jgi:hypothetical protein
MKSHLTISQVSIVMMNLVLAIPEYTPGPVYYKPLPPVSDSPPQNTIYNPYDTMYYQQSKEAVPSAS